MKKITICALLYGNYPYLAKRCLTKVSSLVSTSGNRLVDLRIGTNSISSETKSVLKDLNIKPFIESENNILKYPMMRLLFYDKLIDSDFTMWFDDDSFIKSKDPKNWLDTVLGRMESSDMIGSIYNIRLLGKQHEWIKKQDWYMGKPVYPGYKVRFATGGWWTIDTETLYEYNWPQKDITHRGGDVMLGELFRQQSLKLHHFNEGVAINADKSGRESKAKRRGFDSRPVGYH